MRRSVGISGKTRPPAAHGSRGATGWERCPGLRHIAQGRRTRSSLARLTTEDVDGEGRLGHAARHEEEMAGRARSRERLQRQSEVRRRLEVEHRERECGAAPPRDDLVQESAARLVGWRDRERIGLAFRLLARSEDGGAQRGRERHRLRLVLVAVGAQESAQPEAGDGIVCDRRCAGDEVSRHLVVRDVRIRLLGSDERRKLERG